MLAIRQHYLRLKHAFLTDSLFRNATLLMSSTAILSALGFGFWIFVAHLYTPSQIGIASALISVTTLISNLSLLGLNSGLIRFLPKSRNQSGDINAVMALVAGVTMLAAAAYVVYISIFPANISILADPWHKVAFIILMTTVTLNSLTDAVFIANRRAEFHTAAYAVLGIAKLVLPLFLIPLGSLGIFSAYMISMIISLLFSVFMMKKWCGYQLRTKPNWQLIKQIKAYTTNNYIGVVLAGLPSQLMPMIIIRRLGTAEVAYFSMAWTMANLLYVVPSAATQSLLVESSHDPEQKAHHIRHTTKILSLILVPAVLLSVVIAPYLLRIFGVQYAQGGGTIFQILALTTLPIAVTCVYNTLLNLEQRTSGIVISQLTLLATTFGSVGFLLRYGLKGIGLAILIGNVTACITHFVLDVRYRKRQSENIAIPTFVINQANLAQMLQAYDIADFSYEELGNGSNNYTLLIREGSQRHVLRIYRRHARSIAEIENELAFVRFLWERGIPVPHTMLNKTGTKISHLTDGNGIEWHYMLMSHETGSHPTIYTPKLIRAMARYQAAIHTHGRSFARTADSFHAPKHSSRATKLRRAISLSYQLKGFSHFDFDGSNVLVENDGITSILDFEGMRYGMLVGCMYFTLTQIYDQHSDRTQLRAYIDAYQQIRKLSWLERFILHTALAIHYRSYKMFTLAA